MVAGMKTLVPPSEINNGNKGSSSSSLGKSFLNRRMGLTKKAYELSTLCDTDACIICYGPDGSLCTWPESNEQVEAVIRRFKKLKKQRPDRYNVHLSSTAVDANDKKKKTQNLEPSSSPVDADETKKKRKFDLNLDPSGDDFDADVTNEEMKNKKKRKIKKGLRFEFDSTMRSSSIWDNELEKLPMESLRDLKCSLDSKFEKLESLREVHEEQVQNFIETEKQGYIPVGDGGEQFLLPWHSVVGDGGEHEQFLLPWNPQSSDQACSLSYSEMMMFHDDQLPLSPFEFGEAGLFNYDEIDGLTEQDMASILNDAETPQSCTLESISQAPPRRLEDGFLNNILY